jgi:hypothetical protein
MEASPTEVRIEHSVADQRALTRGFTVFYALIAAAGLVATLFQPELLLGTVFFALVVAWWSWRIRRAQANEPWLVVLTPEELRHSGAGVDVRIARAEANEVVLETRAGPRMRLHVLEVRGADGDELLTVSLAGRDESTVLEAAFEEWGWPVRG